uniref:F-box domain-containing protein n=1 Tax=Stomoxys calcitrans TaxID=35570 RepID=A0A1I8NXD2_STOCA
MEEVWKNVDVLLHIYRMLDLDDQIRLSRVNVDLKAAFEMFIFHKEDYSILSLNVNQGCFVVHNGSSHHRWWLKHHELMEFVSYHCLAVETFFQRNGTILDVRPFRHLTSLSYSNCIINRRHLKLFASLPLEKLDIVRCTDEFGRDIMPGNAWNVEYLMPMSKLRSLKVMLTSDFRKHRLSFGDFSRLVTATKLENISLDCSIVLERLLGNEMDNNSSDADVVALKHLDIGLGIGQNYSLLPYGKLFSSLVTLTICMRDPPINNEILMDLNKICGNLEELHFKWSTFQHIEDFCVPPKLKGFSLSSCNGLNADNLRQILNLSHLKKFNTTESVEQDDAEMVTISSSLEHLFVDEDYWYSNVVMAFGGSENLKHLSWLASGFVEYSEADAAALRKCTHLEELNVKVIDVPSNIILKLNLLKKLSIKLYTPSIPWCHIEEILKHSNLQELTLDGYFEYDDPPVDVNASKMGFAIGVKLIQISDLMFKIGLHFWLDLLKQNIQLQLIVSKLTADKPFIECMRTMINHEKFPHEVKTLKICCSLIKCRDLKQNFEATMKRVIRDLKHTLDYNQDEFQIIFDRNLGEML